MKRCLILLLIFFSSFYVTAAVGSLDNIRISNLHTKNEAGEINKLVASGGKWSINFDMEIIGPVQGGDTYNVSRFGPKTVSHIDSSILFPKGIFMSGVGVDVINQYDIKIGEEVVGTLKAQTITFNENISKYQDAKVSVSIGVGSIYPFNMKKDDPLFGSFLPERFYLNINGQYIAETTIGLKAIERRIVTPLIKNGTNQQITRTPVDGKVVMKFTGSPYGTLKEIRDNGNWETDVIKVIATLPTGMTLKEEISISTGSRYLNESDTYNDNNNIYDFYTGDGFEFNLVNRKLSETTFEGIYTINKRPFNENEGSYEAAYLGDIIISDLSLINWETGDILGGGIKLDYYINDVFHNSITYNKLSINIPVSSLEAEGLLPKNEFKITAEVINGIISNEGTVTFNRDETVTYNFKPKEGYKIKSILIDGIEQEVLGDSYTFEKLDKDYTIKVIYEKNSESKVPATGVRNKSFLLILFLTIISLAGYRIFNKNIKMN